MDRVDRVAAAPLRVLARIRFGRAAGARLAPPGAVPGESRQARAASVTIARWPRRHGKEPRHAQAPDSDRRLRPCRSDRRVRFGRGRRLDLLHGGPLHNPPPPAPADLVLTNGVIYTVDGGRTIAEALAVEGDTIVYVGDVAGAAAFIGPDTGDRPRGPPGTPRPHRQPRPRHLRRLRHLRGAPVRDRLGRGVPAGHRRLHRRRARPDRPAGCRVDQLRLWPAGTYGGHARRGRPRHPGGAGIRGLPQPLGRTPGPWS